MRLPTVADLPVMADISKKVDSGAIVAVLRPKPLHLQRHAEVIRRKLDRKEANLSLLTGASSVLNGFLVVTMISQVC